MDITLALKEISSYVLGWPLIIGVVVASVICTVITNFVQIKWFIKTWKLTLFPEQKGHAEAGHMTSMQAFINSLSTSLGNGSIAGVATALYAGGPGAAFWLAAIGILLMAVRYCEVYLSSWAATRNHGKSIFGGPMLYLKQVPFGQALAWVYSLFGLFFTLSVGNAMQTNSIRLSITSTWNISPELIALVVLAFIACVVYGGAARIIKVSDAIVPVKVAVFFISSAIVLFYHAAHIPAALMLIFEGAFKPTALAGGMIGFSVQQAMRLGIFRSIMATEAGLGTAAILFGATGSKEPVEDGLMSMLSTFICTVVCFIVALCIIASGVWNNGQTSTALTVSAFNTVFGQFGGWVVSFLSLTFGIGVLVTFAYITRELWLFVTGGRWGGLYNIVYCGVAALGVLAHVDAIWALADIINAGMLVINVGAILYLLPVVRHGLREYIARKG